MQLVEKYIHGLFPIWGIRFIGMVDGADTSVKGNKKARQINGLVNQWYLENLSDNIKATLKLKRIRGKYTGSVLPYGYRPDPDDINCFIESVYVHKRDPKSGTQAIDITWKF